MCIPQLKPALIENHSEPDSMSRSCRAQSADSMDTRTGIERAPGRRRNHAGGGVPGSSPRTREKYVCGAREGPGQIRHAATHRAEVESPARKLFQLDTQALDGLDRSLDGVDRRVEVALGGLKCRLLGLSNLLGNAAVLGLESRGCPGSEHAPVPRSSGTHASKAPRRRGRAAWRCRGSLRA